MLVENDPGGPVPAPGTSDPELTSELKSHVQTLALDIGERNIHNPGSLHRTLAYIKDWWEELGLEVRSQDFFASADIFTNLWVEIEGTDSPDEVVVLGAHYDTFPGTPGADDNGTAVAGLLSVTKRLSQSRPKKTVRFVAFANEEPPYFMSDFMGSYLYARQCKSNGDNIAVMVCLEMLGYFDSAKGSQSVTYDLLPEVGDFIALCGNEESRSEVLQAGEAFRKASNLPMSLVSVSEDMVPAIAYSDHWSFWKCGWPAFMVTDTGPLRNPHYHQGSDLPATIDYEGLTQTVLGVESIMKDFSGID